MDAEQAEFLQTSPLIQRLDRRRTQAGVINLSRYSTEFTGLPNSIVRRSALVEQLQTRYSSRDSDSAGRTELALATASPVPTERVFRSPEVTPVGAIAPSLPLATTAPFTSEPLPLSSTTIAMPTTDLDSATFTTAPAMIAPFNESVNESVSESAIASTAPNHEYRIRRVSANPTQATAIQRKAASDSSAAIVSAVSPVQSSHEAVSIAPESPPRARVDDPTSAPIPTLDGTPTTTIAPISPLHSIEPTAEEATLVLRHALSDTPPAIAQDSIAQNSIAPVQSASVAVPVARPLVQAVSPFAIVQRSPVPNSQSMLTGFSHQEPAAIAPVSINELPLQSNLISRSRSDVGTISVLQRRIQPDLPLAISPIQVIQPAIARQTETNGASTIALVPSSPEVPPPIPTPTSANAINVGQIAEQVSRILFRQLTVERERRGMGKWS